jgi:hypothetical protein
MRESNPKRQQIALGLGAYQPTEPHREMVVILKLNGTPHQRIAMALKISLAELEYWYPDELELGEDAVLFAAAKRVLALSAQNVDLGVSLRASQAILQPRLKTWREPKLDPATSAGDIDELTLEQVEREIARLERERRAAFATQDEAETAHPDEAQPQ